MLLSGTVEADMVLALEQHRDWVRHQQLFADLMSTAKYRKVEIIFRSSAGPFF